jgi:hypothetical protein
MAYILDGNVLQLDVPFTHDGIKYPANWLRLSTQADRNSLGITWRNDQTRPDDRFYWVTENADGSYTATPKNLDDLKTAWTAQINQSAWNQLMPSDWMVVRQTETSVAVPAEWTTYRAAVRTVAADTVTAIDASANIDDFIAVVTNVQWPRNPNDPQPVVEE